MSPTSCYIIGVEKIRDVVQPGRALAWGLEEENGSGGAIFDGRREFVSKQARKRSAASDTNGAGTNEVSLDVADILQYYWSRKNSGRSSAW